jgi:hypothetical protein
VLLRPATPLGAPDQRGAERRCRTQQHDAAQRERGGGDVGGVVLLRPATPLGAPDQRGAAQLAVAPYAIVMSARALRLRPLRPLRAGLRSAALAGIATLAAFLVAALPGAPPSAAAQIILRLAVSAVVFLPAAAWLLRADLREAWRSAVPTPRADSSRGGRRVAGT